MRLLNARTLRFESYPTSKTPTYVVLTHTWSTNREDEVLFQDIVTQSMAEKPSFLKVAECCRQAVKDQISHVWIDSCCIDSSSSAEVSEAINSMYRWYKEAASCYGYLSDVSLLPDQAGFSSEFAHARWFSRGWTLQELLAPKGIKFYSKDWQYIGSKQSLLGEISKITRISCETLLSGYMLSVSVATRMSWASNRETTIEEDQAYCLLGIFGVNMPLLYGEGLVKAFARLQEQIMKDSDDHSLFAWEVPTGIARNSRLWKESFGILANAPHYFQNSGSIIPLRTGDQTLPFSMTNKGLHIRLPLLIDDEPDKFTALLKCQFDSGLGDCVGITLVRHPETGMFWRAPGQIRNVSYQEAYNAKSENIYISKTICMPERPSWCICWVRAQSMKDYGFKISELYPPHWEWNPISNVIKSPTELGLFRSHAGFLFCDAETGRQLIVIATMDNQRWQGSVRIFPKQSSKTLREAVLQHLDKTTDVPDENQRQITFTLPDKCSLKDDSCLIEAEIGVKNVSHSKIWILDVKAIVSGKSHL